MLCTRKICMNFVIEPNCILNFRTAIFAETICLNCSRKVQKIKRRMSVVPHGAFAAKKYRQNEDLKRMNGGLDLSPPNYSSKFMNSVWGMYNRYSVHNLKKIMDNKTQNIVTQQRDTVEYNKVYH